MNHLVTATPSTYREGSWMVGPLGKVGAARIGDIELRLKPKVEIARLLFLLGYSQHAAAWQPETADLVPVIAQALWRQTGRANYQGLRPGYIVVEESSQVFRGRLRESEQLRRHHGLPLPLEIRHDEFTTDIPENRIQDLVWDAVLVLAGHLQAGLQPGTFQDSRLAPLPPGRTARDARPRRVGTPAVFSVRRWSSVIPATLDRSSSRHLRSVHMSSHRQMPGGKAAQVRLPCTQPGGTSAGEPGVRTWCAPRRPAET